MKRKLATLTIWLDNEDTDSTSSSDYHQGDSSSYTVTLRPKGDLAASPFGKQTPDILAHELGHFIGTILNTPVQAKSGWDWTTPVEQLAGEKEAWRLAGVMKPGLDKSPIAKDALESYEETARRYPDIPRVLLGLR